jgi:hypothetical protein
MKLKAYLKRLKTAAIYIEWWKEYPRLREINAQLGYIGSAGVVRLGQCSFVLQPSASEFEVATGKLERYKSASVEQIPPELIQAGGEILDSKIYKLIKMI